MIPRPYLVLVSALAIVMNVYIQIGKNNIKNRIRKIPVVSDLRSTFGGRRFDDSAFGVPRDSSGGKKDTRDKEDYS